MTFDFFCNRAAALVAAACLGVAAASAPGVARAGCEDFGAAAAIEAVRAERARFNAAIAAKDIDAIAGVLAEKAILVTGTASDVYDGRDAQLALWRNDFESPDRAVYVRTSACVRASPVAPVALEFGAWRGERSDPRNFAAGRYAAKWRLTGGAWRLESETFATEACGGDFCPGAAARE